MLKSKKTKANSNTNFNKTNKQMNKQTMTTIVFKEKLSVLK